MYTWCIHIYIRNINTHVYMFTHTHICCMCVCIYVRIMNCNLILCIILITWFTYAYTCWNEDIVMLNNLKICQLFCCGTRINQLRVPVRERRDPGLKIVSFPLWERRQSPLTHGQDSHTSCRVAARQLHLSAVHEKTSTQNKSEFTSSAGSEWVRREELHYHHGNTSDAYYYPNTALKRHTSFPACPQMLTHKTSSTSVSKYGWLTCPSFRWTSPGTRAVVLCPPPHCSEAVDNRYLPRNISCCYYC